jgi:hypothetical protein
MSYIGSLPGNQGHICVIRCCPALENGLWETRPGLIVLTLEANQAGNRVSQRGLAYERKPIVDVLAFWSSSEEPEAWHVLLICGRRHCRSRKESPLELLYVREIYNRVIRLESVQGNALVSHVDRFQSLFHVCRLWVRL